MSPSTVLPPAPTATHPLDPPTSAEIQIATKVLRTYLLEKEGVKAFKFTTAFLAEPPKAAVIAAIKWPGGAAPDAKGSSATIDRSLEVHVIDIVAGIAYEAFVRVDGPTPEVKKITKLAKGIQPGLTPEELDMASQVVRKDARVIKFAADVGIKEHEIYADGWSIGYDMRFPGRRLQQCLLFARLDPDGNLYAHPLDFMPVLDADTFEILAIDFPPHRVAEGGKLSSATTEQPPASFDAPTDRARIPPPLTRHDYLPELVKDVNGNPMQMRTDLKPLSVVQPEGVSFTRKGNVLEWQKWKMHIGFHPREGIVLSTISYKDTDIPGATADKPIERPLFYRIGVSEMVVPYGEPVAPHYKKFAFDIGEYGLGSLSNSLALGCDCLGSIEYMDGQFVKHDGSVETVKNAICIHEEDSGILWKHTDYRTGGRVHAVRGRKLVIQMVCTVANYEYILSYQFHMDGNIELELKLTGILNQYLLAQGESPAGFGTEVAPQINAHYHQHLFSLRLDPHIDGPLNSVMEQNVSMLASSPGSKENYAGNGFTTESRILKTTGEGVRDAQIRPERTWTIVNENIKHYSSGKPVGYKIVCKDLPPLYAHKDSIVSIRAPFAKHHLWTVPYSDDHRYPAGRYVPQTEIAPEDSIEKWIGDGTASIANQDIATYLTFGTTHIPRPEDFPVMPAEIVRLHLKPIGFFRRNPALDVPATDDNASRAANAGVNGAACCV